MRVLALDTATEVCGVAVAEGSTVLAETALDQGLTHTKVLLAEVDSVLNRSGVRLDDLDALVVSRGPGSFTGLRIGIATAKGLAAATGKPLVSVSSLAVLAHQAPAHVSRVCPMIDARRREVYWAVYQRQDDKLEAVTCESAGPVQDALDDIGAECLFIGNGARLYAETIKAARAYPAHLAAGACHNMNPGILALLGIERLKQGLTEDLNGFTPIYLRKSDAEMGKKGEPQSPPAHTG